MMVKTETVLDTRLDEVPTERKFLLEFDHEKLARSNMHDQTCWVVAMEAAIETGKRTAAIGARCRRVHPNHKMNMSRSARLGITETEEIIRFGGLACGSINGEQPTGVYLRQTVIKPLSKRQGSSYASISANPRSSKRYTPGD